MNARNHNKLCLLSDMDRKAELQRKKEKLAAIKARKEQERQKLMEAGGGAGAGGKPEALDTDELLKSLGIANQASPLAERGPSPSTPNAGSDGGMRYCDCFFNNSFTFVLQFV